MPVTTRYSASLDRTYEDGGDQTKQQSQPPPPPPHPQPAPCSSPPNYQSEWENGDRAMRSDISVGNSMEDGLSDSMDSLALDDDSNSSASGHSRQHSSDGGSSISPAYPTRPLSNLRPSAPVFNPLQFVKTAASPLVKQAEAQMKQYEEVKKVKELVKEEAEEWQSNLDIWKNRRRLVSQKSVQRAEETKQIEEELDKKRRKSKTFSEMMEERSKRGPSKSLPSVFSEDDWSPQVPLAVEEDLDDPTQHEQSNQNGNGVNQNGKNKSTTPSNGHNRAEKEQPLSGFEEAIRSYAEYAEETNSRARTKLGSGNGNTASETYTTEEPEVVEMAESQQKINDRSTKEFKEEKEEVLSRDPGATLNLSVHLRRQSDQKDFGFSIKSVKGVGTGAFVETVQPQSPAATAGLQVNDELLAINGEKCTSDRSHSAIVFAIKQAVYTGQLHLTIYRYDNPASVLQNPKSTNVREVINSRITEDSPKVDVGKRRSLFERAVSPERAAIHRRSLDMSYSLKDKAASFEGNHSRAKSTERLNTKVEKHGNGDVSSVDDSHPQVGSGLKCGFELASTLQETPIVNSAPSSPLLEPQLEMDFDLMREEILVVVNEEPLNQSVKPPEPPKEKPPPPPPPQVSECDPAADPAFNKTVKLRRVESTKRIRSEISKRRSNFLGIEDDEFQKQLEHEMSQVSPPPNADEILLKMEKELLAVNTTGSDISDHSIQEIESSLLSPTSSSMTNVDDIDQKEREIIESLEQWEEEQKLKVAGSEVVEAEKVVTQVPVAATAVKMVLGQTNESPVNEITRNDKVLEEKELLLKQQEERLRSEKEKLRREQEELMRQKEEYEKQIQRIQQQQIQMAAVQVGLHVEQLPVVPKTKSPQVIATESLRPSLSKGPPPPIMTKPKLNEGSSFSSTDEEVSSPPQFQPQILTKPNLVAISAPPKAKLMDGEEWMHRKKRENYHQHWLVQEAEFRRLQAASQMKESEPPPLAEDRLVVQAPSSPSKHHVIDIEGSPQQRSPLRQVSAPNGLSDGKTQGHLQKPAPRPPAKPVFHQPSSSVVDRRSLPPLSPKVNPPPPPPPPPPLNQLSSTSASNDTQILSVSGKKRCSHCGIELGRGAAMIIESLQLFYHIGCFKCCVCHVQLGNGSSGTDVRVRSQKLHCHNCYSNDEGLKFSKV